MFRGFPKLSQKLLDILSKQFLYFVKQDYGYAQSNHYLYSPFKEDYKAIHYFERLDTSLGKQYFDLRHDSQRVALYKLADLPEAVNSYIKILEHNYKLDDETRYKIAWFVKAKYPEHFQLMIKNNFRIVIGDNFGDVFYNIRIGQGVLLPVRETDLEKLSHYVQGPQSVL